MNKERILMFTAMRIMEIFDEMSYSQHLNPYKMDSCMGIERLILFGDWSEEFFKLHENDFEKKDFDIIEETDYFAQKKLNQKFGIEDER